MNWNNFYYIVAGLCGGVGYSDLMGYIAPSWHEYGTPTSAAAGAIMIGIYMAAWWFDDEIKKGLGIRQ